MLALKGIVVAAPEAAAAPAASAGARPEYCRH